jgi:hypothetical protein
MTTPPPICINCIHFDKNGWRCKAFTNGIPQEIIIGDNDHKKPLKGQKNDIVFEKIEALKGDMPIDIDTIKAELTETIKETIGIDKAFVENLVKSEIAKLDNKSEIENIKETLKEATESIQTSFHAFNRVNEVAIKQGDQTIEGKVNELAEVVKQIEVSPVVEVNTDSAEVISEIRDMRTDLVAGFMDLKMAINEKGNFEIQFERDANGFLKSPIKVIRK